MSKLTIDDLVQAQQRNEDHLKRIAALLRDDAPKPLSRASHYVIILTYFFLFLYTMYNLNSYSMMMNRVESAPHKKHRFLLHLTRTHLKPTGTTAMRPIVPEHEMRISPASGPHLCFIR